jgi:hypothetical protein
MRQLGLKLMVGTSNVRAHVVIAAVCLESNFHDRLKEHVKKKKRSFLDDLN